MMIEGWIEKKLTDLAEYINGYAFKPDDWERDGLPIIRIEQLKNPKSVTDFFSGPLPEKNIINNGDLIFSWSASLFLSIWKHGKAALNQHLFKVVEKDDIDRKFLKLFIEFYLPEITKASHGSTMKHITRKELDRFGALVPKNKSEQNQIAIILSTLDRAIEQTEALIAKQQRIKTGLMQDLLTRGIDEQGNIRSEATHKFKDSPLGRIPVEWEVENLGDKFSIQSGFTLGKHRHPKKNTHPYLRVANVRREKILLNDLAKIEVKPKELKNRLLEKDDLLVVEGHANPEEIGRCAIVTSESVGLTFQNHLFRLRTEQLEPHFSLVWLNSHWVRSYWKQMCGTSSGLNTINRTMLIRILVPFPPSSEQKRISKVLYTQKKYIEQELDHLSLLKQTKTGLMQDLLTGKVRVTSLLKQAQ